MIGMAVLTSSAAAAGLRAWGACLGSTRPVRSWGPTQAGLSGMSWSAGAIVAPAVGIALLPLGPNVLWGGIGLIGAASGLGALLTGGPVRRRVKEIR